MLETWVRSLGLEDLLEKEISTHSSILAWKIPWTEEPGRLQSMGSQRVRHDWVTLLTYFLLPKHSSLTRKRWASLFLFCLVKIAFLHVDLQFQCVEHQVLMGGGIAFFPCYMKLTLPQLKVLVAQSCPTLCDPMDCSPPWFLCPWNSPGKNTGVDCHFLLLGIFQTQGIEPRSPTW